MVDFEKLQEEILRQRPDLNKDTLLKMVGEKKKRVGAGYLTDQGALFLVASDLNVSLDQIPVSDLTLKDLYVGVNEITVVGRVFTIYPLKKYIKKDGSEGQYRRLVLFDGDTFAHVTLWDDKARTIEELKLKPDSIVRVVKGYVRAGLDSRPVLNLGVRGSLEMVDQKDIGRIPFLKDITKDILNINSSETHLSIQGVVISPPKISEFVKRNGEPGKVIQLFLGRTSNSRGTRVAIWNNDYPSLINLQNNSIIRLVGLKSRLLPSGEFELHGDEGTSVDVIYAPSPIPPKNEEIQARVFRILSQRFPRETSDGLYSVISLVSDKEGKLFTLIARGDAAKKLQDMENDSFIECIPRESGPSTLICEDDSMIRSRSEVDPTYPSSSTFMYKIDKLANVATPIFVEVIALSRTIFEDILTKDGSTVKKAEVVVGDDTGEVKMIAWRNLTQVLEGIMPGQRLLLGAVVSQRGRDGEPLLQVKAYSSIKRVP